MEFVINNNKCECIENNSVLGYVTFLSLEEKVVEINHTVVLPEAQGKGIASKMLSYVCEYFLKNQIKVKASCSYASNWFLKHDEFNELFIK